MGDQASGGLLCSDGATLCPWRIFLYPSVSQRRWLPARGFERGGVAKPQRKYSAVLILEIALRAVAAEAGRTNGQGKRRATLSTFDGFAVAACKRLLRPCRHARTETCF